MTLLLPDSKPTALYFFLSRSLGTKRPFDIGGNDIFNRNNVLMLKDHTSSFCRFLFSQPNPSPTRQKSNKKTKMKEKAD
jgi:hypothetical protein